MSQASSPREAMSIHAGRFSAEIGDVLVFEHGTYQFDRFLGRGAYGDVYKVTDVNSGRMFALKGNVTRSKITLRRILNELNIMAVLQMHHTSFFPIVENIFFCANRDFIVMELLTMNLEQRYKHVPPPLSHIRIILHQLLSALNQLRRLQVVHFDLKLQNIMLVSGVRKDDLKIKVIDFSCAYFDGDVIPTMDVSTTPYIRSPELLLRYRISHIADIWSLAVSILKLYLHQLPVFAAIQHLHPKRHVRHMLKSLEMTFGPIPSELLAEGAETHRYYQRSSDGLYSLTRSLWDAEVRGCNLKDLKPKALPEECITPTAYDLETYEIERQEFLDLIGRMLAYKDRISSDEALKHPFLTMQNLLASNLKRTQHVQRTLHLNSLNNMAPPIPLHYTKLIFN